MAATTRDFAPIARILASHNTHSPALLSPNSNQSPRVDIDTSRPMGSMPEMRNKAKIRDLCIQIRTDALHREESQHLVSYEQSRVCSALNSSVAKSQARSARTPHKFAWDTTSPTASSANDERCESSLLTRSGSDGLEPITKIKCNHRLESYKPSLSDDLNAEDSPDVCSIHSASCCHTKTLACLGQNHVTFSPTRVTYKDELEAVHRTEDANLEMLGSCEDFGDVKRNSTVSVSQFKIVDLPKESVTEWFTGKSRQASIKVMPTIFEDDDEKDEDVWNDEAEQEEDIME